MKSFLILLIVIPCVVLAELVKLDFQVSDYEGNPLSDVQIDFSTGGKLIAPYRKMPRKRYSCKTGKDGTASERFLCWDGFVNCCLKKDGYYSMSVRDIMYGASYDARTGGLSLATNHQSVVVKMKKIRSPERMVIHGGVDSDIRLPAKNGAWGFDLEIFDWVHPYGKGKNADFTVNYDFKESENDVIAEGFLEFEGPYSGAYLKKKDDCRLFPVAYSVNTNEHFVSRIDFRSCLNKKTKAYSDRLIVGEDEYMVVRSRVVTDDKGNIERANYSHIQGVMALGREFTISDCFYNPRVNDLNMEYVQQE